MAFCACIPPSWSIIHLQTVLYLRMYNAHTITLLYILHSYACFGIISVWILINSVGGAPILYIIHFQP